ncbi:TetR family transcriptional regulator [Amycolatopsis echigonensis]|nr:TetR family transcriptional regulator [Amycolatopsis niigatensis]
MLLGVDTARAGNRRGRRSREEILDTASRIMAERGYSATTMSVLSTETGLPKSAIYHHFQSKGGLLSAVMERGAYEFFRHLRESQANPPEDLPPAELLGWFLQRTGEVFVAKPDFLRLHLILLMSAEAVADVEVKEIIERVRVDGRRHMRRMISQSWASLGPEAAEKVGEALDYFGIAGFDGAFVAWQAEPDRSMRDQMALLTEAMVAIAERVLAG